MSKFNIDPKKISVVIQGPVVGNNEVDNKKKFTKRSLKSARKYLPGAQIILSSWVGSDTRDLDYDDLVLNTEPEKIKMVHADGYVLQMTTNFQIISSQNGLRRANREYAIKMRSDMILTGTNFIKYYLKYNKNKGSDILKNKVLVLPTYNPKKNTKLLFNTCDWFFFGRTEDVKNIFDIPLMDKDELKGPKINDLYLIENNFQSEQYIWISFLKKYQNIDFPNYNYFTKEALESSEESYAKYTIMVPANKAQIKCLKMPNAGYGAIPFLSQGLYTFNEYKKMYNKYNEDKILIIYNPLEDFLYFLFLNGRLFFKEKTPNLYKKIINFIRRCNGSYNLLK